MDDKFDAWWEELVKVAKNYEFGLSDKEDYREYFDDGDAPLAVIFQEMAYD